MDKAIRELLDAFNDLADAADLLAQAFRDIELGLDDLPPELKLIAVLFDRLVQLIEDMWLAYLDKIKVDSKIALATLVAGLVLMFTQLTKAIENMWRALIDKVEFSEADQQRALALLTAGLILMFAQLARTVEAMWTALLAKVDVQTDDTLATLSAALVRMFRSLAPGARRHVGLADREGRCRG